MKVLTKSAPAGDPLKCHPSSGNRCVIVVAVADACTAVSVPEFIGVDEKQHDKIEFVLTNGYVFCPNAGDGVYYSDPKVTDPPFEFDPHGKCSQTLDWKRKKKKDDQVYGYWLRFRNELNNTECSKDPFIRNG